MSDALQIQLNGQQRSFPELTAPSLLEDVIAALALKADRVAVERNGAIAPRASWGQVSIHSGDKLEIVHFVGGGA